MLYLHMSLASIRMMDTFTRMIRRNFPLEEHRFLYWDELTGNDRALLDYGNSAEITGQGKERLRQLLGELDRADVIIWHGLMFGAKRALLLLIFRKYFRKSVWVMRGIDLYNWKKESSGLKARLIDRINYLCRKGMPNVAAIFHTDEEVYRKQFGGRAKVFYLPYPIAESAFDLMEEYRGSTPRPSGKVYVQVAHNAYAFNNHLEILDNIAHFKDENLRVIIPLSYGNDWSDPVKNYFRIVSERAKSYFGSKAVCLKRLMPPDEYSELLCNIDISVYGAARQNGLGNILRSLYIGNKVYLSTENPMYRYFRSCGIDVGATESIAGLTFEEFCKPSDPSNAVDWIRRNYYPDASAVYWKAMFDFFRNGQAPEEDLNSRIDAVLAEAFPEKQIQPRTKKNYVNLGRYVEHPVGTVYPEIRDVLILGTGGAALHVFQRLCQANQRGTRWSIAGFVDYRVRTIGNQEIACDVIGSPDEIEVSENMHYINAIEEPEERRRAAGTLAEKGAHLENFGDVDAEISPYAELGEGCLFLGACTVLSGAHVGGGTVMKSAFVEYSARVGAYCTLERGCWIGEGASVGDGALIGAYAKIAPGVRVGSGKRVAAFSVVTEDIL